MATNPNSNIEFLNNEFESLFQQFLQATHPWHEELLLAEASAVLREIGESHNVA